VRSRTAKVVDRLARKHIQRRNATMPLIFSDVPAIGGEVFG
jgi:hypothetical protein